MDRFFGAFGNEEQIRQLKPALQADPSFAIMIDRPRSLVAVGNGAMLMSIDAAGLVIGPLFMIGRSARATAIAAEDAARIRNSGGDCLTRSCWGGYVAILADPHGARIDLVRAPFGELPCLYAPVAGGWLLASDIDLLEAFGDVRFQIDWPAVARFVAAPDLRSDETCLAGLREIRGGDRLTLTPSASVTASLWSPWKFTEARLHLPDAEDAARRLRSSAIHAIGARAGLAPKSVLMLSGGLDSSVVAAGAAAHGVDLHCVNVRTRNPSGDESRYARSVCDRAGLPLIDRWPAVDGVDLERSDASRLPRPATRAFGQAFRRQALNVAREVGARQLLSGGGGDNLFCSQQSVLPLVDCLAAFDDRQEFWRVAREICELTGASLWTVVRRAWLRSCQTRRQAVLDTDLRFLSASAVDQARARPPHPWLERPAGVPPGKGAHVALLIGPQGLTEDGVRLEELPLLFPLMSQPLVELCLRIPSWLWFDRGCNRAVARHAFAPDLPAEVAWRRSKGSPDSFLVELFEANRAVIRAMLLDGLLAGHGLLDLATIARFLDDRRPVRGSEHGRILRLVDVEAWCRHWLA